MNVLCRISSFTRFPKCHFQQHIRGFKVRKSGKEGKLDPVPQNTTSPEFSPLSKHILYTAFIVPTTFTGCVIWHYETIRKKKMSQTQILPVQHRHPKEGNLRDHFNLMWNKLCPGKKVALGIASVNFVVYLLWKSPSMVPFLSRYFTCCPTKGHSVVASTLSAFSHQSGAHLFVNMYVLWSFSSILVSLMGKEQFIGIYLGAATFSGLMSLILKVARRSAIPSVGASGAIMCMLAIVCKKFPDANLQIAIVGDFIPHSFKASSALIGIVSFDLVGVLMKWRVLDHAGHLGGSMFGLAYAYLVDSGWIAKIRWKIMDVWHRLRK